MAGETQITIIGNLTSDPELRFTASGTAVANFTVASTPRNFDKQSNEFKDGETLFLRCSVWREAAENVSETLTKGMRVVAQGRLKSRSFTDKDENNRTVMELDVDEIGPSLRYASAKVTRSARGAGEGTANRSTSDGSWTPPAAGGGWGANAGGNGGWSSSGQGEEAPF